MGAKLTLQARVIPYSSVVGSGIMLVDKNDKPVAQIALLNVNQFNPGANHREVSTELAELIARRINGEQVARAGQGG